MKLTTIAKCIALIGVSSAATGVVFAQDKPVETVQKVEITGSSIKRIQKEGALPIQLISREDILRAGITSAEQLVASLSGNGNGIDNMTTNQGGDFLNSTADRAHNNGASGASLRGLGAQYTLVLLNGRRISTHGLNGKSVDLNSVPLAAVDRVEILKDGASAIYGTDAIGGVINFILRKDYQGLEATLFSDTTQHGGGNIYRGSMLFGIGDLSSDKFNLMASLTYDTNDRLRGSQRDFHKGFQPDRGLAIDTTGTPYATIGRAGGTALSSNFTLPGDSQSYSKANLLGLQGKCNSVPDMYAYRGDITGFNANNKACSYDYGKQWSLMQPVDRINLVSRGTFALTEKHTMFAEVIASQTKSAVEYTPIQITTAGGGANYPAFIKDANGNTIRAPYYQDLTGLVPGFDNTKSERIRWRCLPCGPRQQETTADAYRALLGMEGEISGWDYKLGVSASKSKASTILGDGYMFQDKLTAAVATGLINPFLLPGQTQTAQAMELINGAKAKGSALYGGEAGVTQLDGTFSRELLNLPAGPLGVAVGFDIRKENYRFNQTESNYSPINGVAAPASLDKVSRDIKALFAELQIPIVKDLEMQLAVRRDQYNDFGSTVNPKAGVRWQPMQQVMFRGSYSTGFHAPDFDPLFGGAITGQFNSDINDPILCPTGKEATGCGIRPEILTSSNPNLKPEKSKQLSFGFVISPLPWLTSSIDFWRINLTDRISSLSGLALINNYNKYKQYVIRDSGGEISSVEAPFLNLAGDRAQGVDLNVTANFKTDMGRWTASIDGSYLDSYKSRYSDSDPWTERVGNFGDASFGWDLKLRWKHSANINWSQGPWSISATQNYSGGYRAETDGYGAGFTSSLAPTTVKAYSTYNLSASYSAFKNLTLSAGIKNLFDTKPPFSSHNVDNVAGAGWDGRVGDPRLRAFTLRANYKFY